MNKTDALIDAIDDDIDRMAAGEYDRDAFKEKLHSRLDAFRSEIVQGAAELVKERAELVGRALEDFGKFPWW
jgi:hypothetical protein